MEKCLAEIHLRPQAHTPPQIQVTIHTVTTSASRHWHPPLPQPRHSFTTDEASIIALLSQLKSMISNPTILGNIFSTLFLSRRSRNVFSDDEKDVQRLSRCTCCCRILQWSISSLLPHHLFHPTGTAAVEFPLSQFSQ